MGKPVSKSLHVMVQSFLCSETYEYVYNKNRKRGHALLAHYCHQKTHLKAPKAESLLKGPLPLSPTLLLPPLLLPVEAKPKVRWLPSKSIYDNLELVAEALRGGELNALFSPKSSHTKRLPQSLVNVNLSDSWIINSCEAWVIFYFGFHRKVIGVWN